MRQRVERVANASLYSGNIAGAIIPACVAGESKCVLGSGGQESAKVVIRNTLDRFGRSDVLLKGI